eukprot:TRINITY_DN50811_c0_g1_i1.p1 TRINITY_DN50811_c0_g1~~TRINITY_DN50811_c0_g1_i1.p1  ORF type:complete len:264 (+),score=46.83 TRINITY_DN50811_c0_g1_i1:93-884(+)
MSRFGRRSADFDPSLSGSRLGVPGWEPQFDRIPNTIQIDRALGIDYDKLRQAQVVSASSRAQFVLSAMADKAAYDVCDPLMERYVDCTRDKMLSTGKCKPMMWAMDTCTADMKSKGLELLTKLYLTDNYLESGTQAVEREKRHAFDMLKERAQRIAELDDAALIRYQRAETALAARIRNDPQYEAMVRYRRECSTEEAKRTDANEKNFVLRPQSLIFMADWWKLDKWAERFRLAMRRRTFMSSLDRELQLRRTAAVEAAAKAS